MKDRSPISGKSQIADEILAYLSDHPDAQDTLEGIVEWWLLERKIGYQISIVEKALVELVEQGLVLKNESDYTLRNDKDIMTRYRINHDRIEDVRGRLKKAARDNKKKQ